MKPSLREKCPMQNYFWSVFSRSRTEYGEILSPNTGKYGPEITPHLDTFHTVSKLHASQAQSIARETVITLEKLRDDDYFLLFWKEVLTELK